MWLYQNYYLVINFKELEKKNNFSKLQITVLNDLNELVWYHVNSNCGKRF